MLLRLAADQVGKFLINSSDAKAPGHTLANLISGSGSLFLFRVGGAAVTYVTQVCLARWLGSAELGIYVEAFAWALIFSIVVMLGLNAASMRFVSEYITNRKNGLLRGFVKRSRAIVLASSVFFSALIALLIFQLDLFSSYSERTTVLVAVACVPGLASIRMNSRLCHSMAWFNLAFFPGAVLRPALFFGAIGVLWSQGWIETSAQTMLVHLIVIIVLALTIDRIVVRRINADLPNVPHEYQTRAWLQRGLPLIFVTLFSQFFAELNVAFVGMFLQPETVAIFNAAFRTALLIAFGLIAIDSYVMPGVVRSLASSDKQDSQAVLRRAAVLKIAGASAGLTVFALFGKWILGQFGAEFVDGYLPLLMLGLGQLVRACIGPVGELLAFTGRQQYCLKVYLVSVVALVIAQAVFVPAFGLTGAVIAAMLVMIFADLWLRSIVVFHLGINPSILGRRMNPVS